MRSSGGSPRGGLRWFDGAGLGDPKFPAGARAAPSSLDGGPPRTSAPGSAPTGFPPPGASRGRVTCSQVGTWAGQAAFKAGTASPGQRLAHGRWRCAWGSRRRLSPPPSDGTPALRPRPPPQPGPRARLPAAPPSTP